MVWLSPFLCLDLRSVQTYPMDMDILLLFLFSRAVAVPRPALPRGGGAAPGRRVGLSHPPTVYGHPADLHRNRLNVRSGSDVGPPPYHRRVRAVSVGIFRQ